MEKVRKQTEKFFAIIEKARRIVVSGHVHPDGDCLGSLLGLYHILTDLGYEVLPVMDRKDVPSHYYFLPGIENLVSPDECCEECDVFIGVDAPNPTRLGKAASQFKGCPASINIDHHVDNENYADLNIVFETFSSVSEIVFWMAKAGGAYISLDAAVCLYTGIVTDTGRFQYSNTAVSTFEAAAELVSIGVKPVEIFRQVYENMEPGTIRLLGYLLERIANEDGFCWSYVLQADLKKTGTNLTHTENFVDYVRSVKGCRVAAVFKEVDSSNRRWRVSLRSKGGVDVQKIAARFGGGGHTEASGCDMTGELDQVVDALRKAVREAYG